MIHFDKCTRYKYSKGVHSYRCRLFLWSAESSVKERAYQEAINYWRQYNEDGEYSSIIGGDSAVDKLKVMSTTYVSLT